MDPMTVLNLTHYKFDSKIMVLLPLIEGVSNHTRSIETKRMENHCNVLNLCFELDINSYHDKFIWPQKESRIYNSDKSIDIKYVIE